MGRNSRFPAKTRLSSRNVAIQPRSGANRAAWRKRTSRVVAEAVEDIAEVTQPARRSPVPRAESRPRYRLSREATGQCIARTASEQGREAMAAGEIGAGGTGAGIEVLNIELAVFGAGRRGCRVGSQPTGNRKRADCRGLLQCRIRPSGFGRKTTERPRRQRFAWWDGVYWKGSKNQIWSFLLVPLPCPTRNQLQIEFGGTSIPKEQV